MNTRKKLHDTFFDDCMMLTDLAGALFVVLIGCACSTVLFV